MENDQTQKQGNARHFKWKCRVKFFILKTDKCCHNLESRIIKMECMFNHTHMFKKYIKYIKLEWNQTNTGKHAENVSLD